MLMVLLYALHSRIYSAHRIDYATEHYADFWFFTYGQRISHDKISDFVTMHEEDIHEVFLETIHLAHSNKLLAFDTLYQDGFFLKANASKKKSYTMQGLSKQQNRLSERLAALLEQLKDQHDTPELGSEKQRLENKLAQIGSLQEKLREKIKDRIRNKDSWKAKQKEEKVTINTTDPDSDLMHQKDDSYANSYLKVTATDSKADIIVASEIDGYNDEPHKALPLFTQANANCSGTGESYSRVIADSNFTSAATCDDFEQEEAQLIGPTRAHENESRNPEKYTDAITMNYDEQHHCVYCSEGAVLYEEERYFDKYKQTTIMVFSNKQACSKCSRLHDCTKSKKGYRRVRIDIRQPAQHRALERYKSPEGQALYKKRSHVSETFQGDLKKNGGFTQLLRRGLVKVRSDSILHDIIWNLRRILSATAGDIVWCT